MEYEFDKEIDSILRQVRRDTYVSPDLDAHLDANEISLFAENALTQKARMRVTEHLADCAKCQKILSTVIVLNAEDASENLHTEGAKPLVTEAAIPWYRKLFAFPQLAYTMGGLTVLLAGMIGYVTLQSYNESKSTSVAQLERSVERPRGASGASSDGETVTIEQYSNAANAASNAGNTTMTTTNSASSTAVKPISPTASANANVAASTPTKDQSLAVQSEPTPAVTANNLAEKEQKTEDKTSTADTTYSADGSDRAGGQPNYRQNPAARNQTITPDSRNVQSKQIQNLPIQGRQTQNLPMVNPIPERDVQAAAPPPQENDDSAKAKVVKKDAFEKTRSISGKNFVYKNSVWYDKSYKQQKTINVCRNSDDYKKLDSGLRSIADNLGGTVIIVWNSKAYRIQ